MSARKLAKVAFDAKPKAPFTTTGESFPDGAIIELVSGPAGTNKPNLLLWNGAAAATISSELRHDEQTYVAPEITPSLYHALRLPAKCTEYGSLEDLFSGMAELFKKNLGLSDRQSRLLTAFALSTWLADRLPIAPSLVISAPDEASGIDVSATAELPMSSLALAGRNIGIWFPRSPAALGHHFAHQSAINEAQLTTITSSFNLPRPPLAWKSRKRCRSLWAEGDSMRK